MTDPPSRESTISPVEEPEPNVMATVISVGRLTDQFESNRDDNSNGTDHTDKPERMPSALLEQTAGGAMEMATLLNDPGMKRSESSEILHLTLHQVSYEAPMRNVCRCVKLYL